jgi:hypothetical protein
MVLKRAEQIRNNSLLATLLSCNRRTSDNEVARYLLENHSFVHELILNLDTSRAIR